MIWIYTSNMCKCWRRRAFSVKHQRFILALLMLNLPGFFATSIISRHLWGFAITGNMVTSLSNQPTMVLVYHERYVTRDVPVCWRWVNHESPHSEVKNWKPEDGVGIGSIQLAQMWTLMSFLSNLLNFTVKICSKHEEIPLHQGAPCCCCCCCCCSRPRRRSFIALAGGLSSEEALLQWLDVRRPKAWRSGVTISEMASCVVYLHYVKKRLHYMGKLVDIYQHLDLWWTVINPKHRHKYTRNHHEIQFLLSIPANNEILWRGCFDS